MTTSIPSGHHRIELLAAFIALILSLLSPADCGSVDYCYSDIGCFPLSSEFYHPQYRPVNVRPWHRNRINIYFELFNLHHPEGFVLQSWNRANLLQSRFDTKLETKIIIPGWLDNLQRALWVRRLRDSLLWRWHPVNIIVVNWRNFTPYTIATANTRVVGAELANLLKSIEEQLRYNRSFHHLIGHSLGAHIAGYCGDRMPGLGRITALDPARPFFQHMPKSVRLDRGDAKFVDAIHSDFTPENAILLLMSFGMTTPVGHLDFYPNGPPLLQPGCLRDTIMSVRDGIQRGLEHNSLSVAFLESLRYLTACDHQRSHEWFIESINNRECVFVGLRCREYSGLINGQCTCDDSQSACAIMGIHADQMYLNDLHTDIWPARKKPNLGSPAAVSTSRAPAAQHSVDEADILEQISRPLTKDDVYHQLKQQADNLRQPPLPQLLDQLYGDLNEIHDQALIEFLKNSFQSTSSPFIARPPQLSPDQQSPLDSNDLRRRQDLESNELSVTLNVESPLELTLNHHPKLLSDVDRELEDWYEGNSRWFLKTNHRPLYCANQYQVLVYLGPLRSTSGRRRIRANLIVSIIGSRGQLMNQRFVPRTSNLDSFSMQPFFVLLEGAYSLGNILSVAIGWEARLDPDPIQATISFESNLLESMQSFWPTYHAQYPLLPETFRYDFSHEFRGNPPPNTVQELLSNVGLERADQSASHRIKKRSLIGEENDVLAEGCSVDFDGELNRCSKIDNSLDSSPEVDEVLAGESALSVFPDTNELLEVIDDIHGQQHPLIRPVIHNELGPQAEHIDNLKTSQLRFESRPKPIVNTEFLDPFHTSETKFTAKLHNIGLDLDMDIEDSIVVNQVVVVPLQAHYGKSGAKAGRTFCPPQHNYHLRRDQTVRLTYNLLGKCPRSNSYYSHSHRPIILH